MKTGLLTRNIPAGFARRWLPKALLALPFVLVAAFGAPQASAADIATGTVMVSTGSGKVTEFTQTGTMITQIDTTTGAPLTTGSVFDTAGNFYVTDFDAQQGQVTKFDPTGFLIGPFGGPYNAEPESIVLDAAGNFYVGQAGGAHTILKFDPTGALLATFAPATEFRGTDWIELGADECTLFYTSEGFDILTFDACTNTQGPNFNQKALPGPGAFAHRLLPAGGMLVADSSVVVRLDVSGNLIQTYTGVGSGTHLFTVNLDPDGTSFWTADTNGQVNKVDIASGTVLQSWSSSGVAGFHAAAGLSVKGEIIVSNPQFNGTPGKADCHGKSVSALAKQFGGLNAAATALGFPGVQQLQNAIKTFCGV